MAPDTSAPRLTRALLPALALAALLLAPAAASASDVNPWDGNWHSSLTIYGWLPGIDADIAVPVDTGTAVSKSSSDILDNLSGALMFSGDIRKGDWGFFGDVDWVKFTNQDGRFRSIGGRACTSKPRPRSGKRTDSQYLISGDQFALRSPK